MGAVLVDGECARPSARRQDVQEEGFTNPERGRRRTPAAHFQTVARERRIASSRSELGNLVAILSRSGQLQDIRIRSLGNHRGTKAKARADGIVQGALGNLTHEGHRDVARLIVTEPDTATRGDSEIRIPTRQQRIERGRGIATARNEVIHLGAIRSGRNDGGQIVVRRGIQLIRDQIEPRNAGDVDIANRVDRVNLSHG